MFPAEWHPQAFIQLTWPHVETDWASMMDEVIECYCNISREVARYEQLVVVAQNPDEVRSALSRYAVPSSRFHIIECPINDTWARDHAFLTLVDDTQVTLLDYQFNGWGMKFAANLDNQINRHIFPSLKAIYENQTAKNRQEDIHPNLLSPSIKYQNHLDFVFEGGSIESDGHGTLLTTASCLLAPNRNDTLSEQQIEQRLLHDLQADRLLWLHHGHLIGDDTDGHIDTQARFCPNDTIAYVQCTDPSDPHYDDLRLMEEELRAFRTITGQPYHLLPLPMPDAIYDDGDRLPATYANFLIINGAVLFPTYRQPVNDLEARRSLQNAFPGYDIIGIDCTTLIRQHGSLHCSTMQYPAL